MSIIDWYHKQKDIGMALTIDDLLEFDRMHDSYYNYEIMEYFGISKNQYYKYVEFIKFLKRKDLFYGKFQNN